MSGIVYILRSQKNGRFYIGSTPNLEKRISEHQKGRSKYTSEVLPIELVFSQEFETIKIARNVEYKLKQLKNKKVIEKIISKGKLVINEKEKINW